MRLFTDHTKVIQIWREYGKRVAVSTSLVYVACYYYYLISEPLNADWLTLGFLKYHGAYWYDQIGRWGRRYAEILTFKINNPLVSLIVCLLCVITVAILLIDLWEIKEPVFRLLIGPALAVSHAVVDSMQYMHDLMFYMPAMLAAVLSAYVIVRHRSVRSNIVGIILLIASLSIYQAYLGVFLFVGVGSLILRLLSEDGGIQECRRIAARGVVTAILGCAFYYLFWILTKVVRHTPDATYAGIDSVVGKRSVSELMAQVTLAYRLWIGYYKDNILHLNVFWLVLTGAALISLVRICIKRIADGKYLSLVIVGILFIIMPLASNIMTIAARGYGLEGRTSFQCQLLIPFAAALISKAEWRDRMLFVKGIGMAAILLLAMGYGGRAYSTIRTWDIGSRVFKYQVQTALTHAIEDERYREGMPIVFMDFPDDDAAQAWNPLREYAYNEPYILWNTSDMVILGDWREYVLYYFGVDIGQISDVEYDKIRASEDFNQMSKYPSENAYAIIDGCYVVRFNFYTDGYIDE